MSATGADSDYVHGMELLLRAVQELSLARSMSRIQRIVRAAARELTGCDGATFVLRDDDQCYYADEDAIAPLWKGSRFPLDACVSGWVMRNRTAVAIEDIYRDARVLHDAYRPTFVKSMVMVPIRRLDPIGAIGNYWADTRRPTEREVSLLQALADATSVAMENVELYQELEQRVYERTAELAKANEEIHQLSVTDDLTGLHNRRGFYLRAEPALAAARRDGRGCVLAFLDVDGLKRINDTHGHDAGDNLIADVAEVLRATVQPAAVLARMGGDEFCVLATAADGDPPVLKERLREAFDAFNATRDRPYRISASIGLVHARAADCPTVDELLARADELMYAEKKAKPASRLSD